MCVGSCVVRGARAARRGTLMWTRAPDAGYERLLARFGSARLLRVAHANLSLHGVYFVIGRGAGRLYGQGVRNRACVQSARDDVLAVFAGFYCGTKDMVSSASLDRTIMAWNWSSSTVCVPNFTS